MLLLIGTVSLNVMPLFPPRPRNSWVSGSRRTTEGSAVDPQACLCNNFQVLLTGEGLALGVSPSRLGFPCEAALSKEFVVVVVFLSFLAAVLCRRKRTGRNS